MGAVARRQRADKTKRVVVIGGGPAGLEAAVTASRRGHEVVLYERSDELGGQVKLITRSPRREEFKSVTTWRVTQLAKYGVDVRCNTEATVERILGEKADAVVVATGSVPRVETFGAHAPGNYSVSTPDGLGIKGANQPHVLSSWDVLLGRADGLRHVVVFDDVGYYQSSDPLEYLVLRGVQVTAVSSLGLFASDMIYNDRPKFTELMHHSDVTFKPGCRITEINGSVVEGMDGNTGRAFSIDGVDAVVLSMGQVPINSLYYGLRDQVAEIYRVGDCVTPRRVEHAHFEGHKIGRAL